MNPYDQLKEGERGAWVSIIAYLLLATTKLVVSVLANSQALQADGLNNTTDVITSVAVLIGLRISRKPPDHDHHYGHFKAELIAALIASFIMVTVGLQVILSSSSYLLSGNLPEPTMLAAWTSLGSTAIMFGVYWFVRQLSKKTNSASLHATAQGNLSDALISFGAFLGIILTRIGLPWLDPVIGIIVGFIIIYAAWDIFKSTSHTLTDGFDDESVEKIREIIAQDGEVIKVQDIKGRRHGNQIFVDITIYVDPYITVKEGHRITDRIEARLAEEHGIPHAHIHVEPNK
ncbi:cation diffusion facilitator family transporter [Amphibacillus marinus]|uniref:Cation diffusion facilitator family transporter n=1 Tax=Amphibacillus marinus TaxID=872970 RepID=A0A1H8Q1T4_9BACI|nr:cation diffusion facilitator family transporter [Amphibacillus marinus]SEO48202.1 cation diffusion facilitator family transporter [Amphibacillus marinus]